MAGWDDDDWDAEPAASTKAPVPVVTGSWEDEDVSEEEEVKPKKASGPAPMKPSKARALAMKQREAKEAEARETRLAAMSAPERKKEMQRIVEDADLDNARDLFSAGTDDVNKAVESMQVTTIENIVPKTPADYTKLAEMIGKRCRKLNPNPKRTQQFMEFMKQMMRECTRDLNADDARELSTFMGLISNEKRDAFKRSKGHKKKNTTKKNVKVERNDAYDDGMHDYHDEFDDFM